MPSLIPASKISCISVSLSAPLPACSMRAAISLITSRPALCNVRPNMCAAPSRSPDLSDASMRTMVARFLVRWQSAHSGIALPLTNSDAVRCFAPPQRAQTAFACVTVHASIRNLVVQVVGDRALLHWRWQLGGVDALRLAAVAAAITRRDRFEDDVFLVLAGLPVDVTPG